MSGQMQPETALQALAEKLRTDAIAIFGEGQAERDIIEWFYGSLLAAAPAPVVPDGYVLVPVEPTAEMMMHESSCQHHAADDMSCPVRRTRRNIWARMLAAAPAHPAERQEQGDVQGLSAWIACCDDHLPPEDQQVLCWCDDGGMTFIEVASQHNGFFTDCFHELLPVTHWMPLPAAPALAASTGQEGES